MIDDFLIFNSKSLPFKNKDEFEKEIGQFFKLIRKLSLERHYVKLKTNIPLESLKVFENLTFKEVLNKVDHDIKSLILSLIANKIDVNIEIPIISEEEGKNLGLIEYKYNDESNIEMGCVDLFNTFLISFKSSLEWESPKINIKKYIFTEYEEIKELEVEINNISKEEHLIFHKEILENRRYKIIKDLIDNFSENKVKYLKNKIIVNFEAEKMLIKLNKEVLEKAITVLYDLDIGNKKIEDYTYSNESETVRKNPILSEKRLFTFDNGSKDYAFNHIKNLPKGNRIYYLEKDEKIYICYIGPHLPTKNFK